MNAKELVGRRIQELRKRQGFSQEQIAEKADISSNYLSRIECGKENPTLDMLIKLAGVLKVEMWEMFDFGHNVNIREVKGSVLSALKIADENTLRLISKFLRALQR